MKGQVLEKNRKYSDNFVQRVGQLSVPIEIKKIIAENHMKNFIDLGCGDGLIIGSIKREFPQLKVTGVDISPRRINGLRIKFPKEKFYCADVCNIPLNQKFDFVHSSQVIEHVEDDHLMIKEMRRLLSDQGVLFVSSVMKSFPMIYKFRNNGKFVLDPTHEREYKNPQEFLDLFKKDFRLIKSWVEPVKRNFLNFQIKIPSYYLIYGIWKKR